MDEDRLLRAMYSARYADGLTHRYYRYPAAASPELIREVIAGWSAPGDLVLDPYLGGGTAAVEALAAGRRFVGGDLNSLAVFVARAKTTPLSGSDWEALHDWASQGESLGRPAKHSDARSSRMPLGLRRALGAGLDSANALRTSDQRLMARCALLRVGQWALESHDAPPRLPHLRSRLQQQLARMEAGAADLTAAAGAHGVGKRELRARRRFVQSRAQELAAHESLAAFQGQVRLVATSPPYPGVHVLYSKWQVQGRRETAAPYWIIGGSDGLPPSTYTMGSRTPYGETQYFRQLTEAFASLRSLLHPDALVVQVVGFSRPEVQLPRFETAMKAAGYSPSPLLPGRNGKPLVRQVPNRRWYVRGKDSHGSKEMLLSFRLAGTG